jgi:hypothetical protein
VTVANRDAPIPSRYRLVKAADVATSHLEASGAKNPDYPQGVQNRTFNERRVQAIAEKTRVHELLDSGESGESGPTVVANVGGRLVAVGGNHRMMGVQRAGKLYPQNAERYTQELKARAARYGIDPATVEPGDVLVREIEPREAAEMERLGRDLNVPRPEEYDVKGDAVTYGANLGTGTRQMIARRVEAHVAEAGDAASMRSLLDTGAGVEIVREMVKDGAIPDNKLRVYLDEKTGQLTPEGKAKIENTVLGSIIGDADAIRTVPEATRKKILRTVPQILRAQEAAPDLKAAEKVAKAVQLLNEAKGSPLEQYLRQGQMREGSPTAAYSKASPWDPLLEDLKPTERAKEIESRREIINIANALRRLSPKEFGDYVADHIKSQTGDAGLFSAASERRAAYFVEPPAVKRKRAAKTSATVASASWPTVEDWTAGREATVGSARGIAGPPDAPVKDSRPIGFRPGQEPTRGQTTVRRNAAGNIEAAEGASNPIDEPPKVRAPERRVDYPDAQSIGDVFKPETVEQRRSNPTAKKARAPSGDPVSVQQPEARERPVKAASGNRILTDDVLVRSEEKLKAESVTGGKWLRSAKLFAAKALNPVGTLVERMGLDRLRIEMENEGARVDRTIMERTFGDMDLEDLGKWFRENPEGLQITRKLREGRALTPAEQGLYRSNRAQLDEFMLGKKGKSEGFFRLLDETRATGLADGDLGPRYYPRTFRTIGDLLKLREDVSHEQLAKIIAGNLEMSRVSSHIPSDVPTETAAYYVSQIRKRLTVQREAKRVTAIIDKLEKQGRTGEAEVARDWLKNNVLGAISDLDMMVRESGIRGVLEEKFKAGDKFASSGTLRLPKGEIEIGAQRGTVKVRSGSKWTREPLYEVKVDGEAYPVRYSRLELLGQKYAETVLDRAPATRAVDIANRGSAWLTVAMNTRSFIRASIGNTARTLSGMTSVGDMATGVRQAVRYFRGALEKETVAEWKDVGVLDGGLEAITGGEMTGPMTLADRIGFLNVALPDQISKIISYEMGKAYFARENPGWSAQKVRTAATKYATTTSDLVRRGSRSPMSFNPVWKVFSFLSNATLREAQQFAGQLRGGQYGRAAANVGVRAATVYGLYKLVGEDDKAGEKAGLLKTIGSILPWTWIAEGRLMPAGAIPIDYAKTLAETADDALGQPVRTGFLGLKPKTPKEEENTARKAWPIAPMRNREAKDFLVSPGR